MGTTFSLRNCLPYRWGNRGTRRGGRLKPTPPAAVLLTPSPALLGGHWGYRSPHSQQGRSPRRGENACAGNYLVTFKAGPWGGALTRPMSVGSLPKAPAQSFCPPNAHTEIPPLLCRGRNKVLSDTERVGHLGSNGNRILVRFSFLLNCVSFPSFGAKDRSGCAVLGKREECPE